MPWKNKKTPYGVFLFGGSSGTRTLDQPVMSRELWPTELKTLRKNAADKMHGGVLAPPVRLERTTLRLTAACSTDWAKEEYNRNIRNGIAGVGINLFSRAASSQVSSAPMSLTSVFGMGTGGSSSQSTPTKCTTHPENWTTKLWNKDYIAWSSPRPISTR